jgi:hypothetical protein
MVKLLTELLILFKWLISSNKAERFRDEVEDIKRDPSGSWSERFGRVQSDKGDSDISDGIHVVLPSDNTSTSKRERKE